MQKILILLVLLGTATASAGIRFPISAEGTVQITRSQVITREVLAYATEPVEEALKSKCENAASFKDGGAFSHVTSINLDQISKYEPGAGFGYTVHFVVKGECFVP